MSQGNNSYTHQPVLLDEVVTALAVRDEGIYLDATYGRGGHSRAILQALGSQGRLIAIDRDPQAVTAAAALVQNEARLSMYAQSFGQCRNLSDNLEITGKVDGILLDLGVSSPQLDDPARGFSFMRDGPLDMRMDPNSGVPVSQWLAKVGENEIADVIFRFGEERYSRRIARAIVKLRAEIPITTTRQLAALIASEIPGKGIGKHPATRSFQALRIFINQELEELQAVLNQSLDILASGGRLVVISFHSLEDRIVKRFMREHSQPKPLPRRLPVVTKAEKQDLRIVGKTVRPSKQECMHNPRARSAVLRVAERCQ